MLGLPLRSIWVHPPVSSWVRVTRSSVLYVCFVDRCLSFCTFSFGHCVVCPSSIYRFGLPFCYLCIIIFWYFLVNIKVVIRICKSKKDRQHNGKKKKDKQRSTKYTHKTKDRPTRTSLQRMFVKCILCIKLVHKLLQHALNIIHSI